MLQGETAGKGTRKDAFYVGGNDGGTTNLSVYSDDITYEKANAEVTRNVKTDSDEVPNDSETSEDPEG